MRYQRTGRKGPKANQSNPPHCKMATAIVLPLCWGKKLPEHGGSFPWERGRQGGLLLLPLPTFLRAVEESSWPVSTPIALRGLEDFWPLNWGAVETTGEESPSSLASTIVTGPIAAASRASPCGLLPQRSRDSVQEHPKARGGAGREEKLTWGVRMLWPQQHGLVWMSKAIARRPHCGGEGQRSREPVVLACHPHSRCFEC